MSNSECRIANGNWGDASPFHSLFAIHHSAFHTSEAKGA